MKRVLAVMIFFSFSYVAVAQEGRLDSLIQLLKTEIEQQDKYVNVKIQRIDKLRSQIAHTRADALNERFDLYNSLYHEYKTFISDSAFNYAVKLVNTANALHDKTKMGYAQVKLGFLLLSSGMFKETFDSLNVVKAKNLADTTRVEYYRLLARGYSDLNVYDKNPHYDKLYRALDTQYMDSALMFAEPGSFARFYLEEIKDLNDSNYGRVIQSVNAEFARRKLTYPQQAISYFDLAQAYLGSNLEHKAVEYLVLSSLSDLRAPTKETAAMASLARLLHKRGDSENAYIFIKQAQHDAEFYGARQRKAEISTILPAIAADQLSTAHEQSQRWLIYSAGLTLVVILVVVFMLIIVKQLKKLKAAEIVITKANADLQATNFRLLEADKIKEEYIGYYFNNNSEYIHRIETIKKNIDKKLLENKLDDIRHVVNRINPEQEREQLYANFDKIFLKLFPDFVERFNSFFRPEDRVVLKDGQLMNTELRIFALVRLGIHDAEKIARILGYSVNTIYAYRTRLKSKSLIPNDKFEEKIMEISTVEAPKQ